MSFHSYKLCLLFELFFLCIQKCFIRWAGSVFPKKIIFASSGKQFGLRRVGLFIVLSVMNGPHLRGRAPRTDPISARNAISENLNYFRRRQHLSLRFIYYPALMAPLSADSKNDYVNSALVKKHPPNRTTPFQRLHFLPPNKPQKTTNENLTYKMNKYIYTSCTKQHNLH